MLVKPGEQFRVVLRCLGAEDLWDSATVFAGAMGSGDISH